MSMSSSRRAALAALAALSIAGHAIAQDPRATEVQQAARAWLAIADKLNAEAAYEAAGPKFRSALSFDRWRDAVRLVRFPLGAVEQRTVTSTQFQKNLPALPEGDYALVVFRTAFANKPVNRELVSLERVGNRWVVVGYVIQ